MQSRKIEKNSFSSKIDSGSKLGRTIGFPTLNLDPTVFPHPDKPGVYACNSWFQKTEQTSKASIEHQTPTTFGGALYFGPRLVKNETHNVLEVFLLDFDQEVYDQIVRVQLHSYIRPPQNFASFEEMRSQLAKDIAEVKSALGNL